MQSLAPGEVLTYGITEQARIQARNVVTEPNGSSFSLWVDGTTQGNVRVSLPGRHNVYNSLAALSAILASGFDLNQAVLALAKLPPPPMRLEITHLSSDITLVNDAYNASPLSMRSALEVLAMQPAKRRVAVLGDMLELGAEHDIQHKLIGQLAAGSGISLLVTVGEGGRLIAAGAKNAGVPAVDCKWYPDAAEAAADVAAWMQRDDCILIKASRGMRLEQVAEAIANAAGSHVEG
jgi:UDP-N-acetylmuramoyl-tripeptide--D-alanyl-D-alanine ligase